jgi:hypothetical protein
MPETTASVVYGMYDLFILTGRDWGVSVVCSVSHVSGEAAKTDEVSAASGRQGETNSAWVKQSLNTEMRGYVSPFPSPTTNS